MKISTFGKDEKLVKERMTELNMRTESVHSAVEFRIQVSLFMSYCDLFFISYDFMSM